MTRREVAEVLAKTRLMLDSARWGLADLTGADLQRREAGLHNVAVWGRAVTNVLQNLRSIDASSFDAWYAPWEQEMRDDPLMLFFYRLRTKALKEGGPAIGRSIRLSFNTNEMGPPPPGAESVFIGDQIGGIGWLVRMPDGTVGKHYVSLPGVITSLVLRDAPAEHLGNVIRDQSADSLARLYIGYLSRLVSDAESQLSTLSSASASSAEALPQRTPISESDKPSGNSSRRRRRRRRRA